MLRISIYEDNDSLRESLGLVLESTYKLLVVGMHGDAMNISEDVIADQPDVILMDIDMPGRTGIEAVQLLARKPNRFKILMLTVFDDTERIFAAISSGAVGYLLKKSPAEKIIEAVHQVAEGGAAMTPSIAMKVLEAFRQPKKGNDFSEYELTPKETLVLTHLVQGDSYKMIADHCNMSMGTVRTHIVNIYEKLHVNSKSEAVARAMKSGLLD